MLKLRWYGESVTKRLNGQAAEGLQAAGEALLGQANEKVPLDRGDLMDTGEVSIDEAKLTAAVSYDTPYAVRLHEHPEYRFQRGRIGKWLEKTMNESAGPVRDWIAKQFRF